MRDGFATHLSQDISMKQKRIQSIHSSTATNTQLWFQERIPTVQISPGQAENWTMDS